jgi:hypothetical protein
MTADCYHRALPDEPKFTLLARDPMFYELVMAWANRREYDIHIGDRPKEDLVLVQEARMMAIQAREWRRENNGRWRQP